MKYNKKKRKISIGEQTIYDYLEENNIEFVQEKSFSGCRSPKNRVLRFDFYLPDYKLLIEFQGQHHYNPVNNKYRAKISHYTTVKHDNIKREYVNMTDMKLVCIPYTERKNIPHILNNILLINQEESVI